LFVSGSGVSHEGLHPTCSHAFLSPRYSLSAPTLADARAGAGEGDGWQILRHRGQTEVGVAQVHFATVLRLDKVPEAISVGIQPAGGVGGNQKKQPESGQGPAKKPNQSSGVAVRYLSMMKMVGRAGFEPA
jgi:hypothetical protein